MTETIHFHSGSPLNRISWLRTSSKFLNMVVQTPETRWLVFRAGQLLVTTPANGGRRAIALLPTAQITQFLGEEPFFGQTQKPGESVSSDSSVLEACRIRGAPVVFLGLKEPDGVKALPSSEFRTPEKAEDIQGAPYFSLDIAHISPTDTDAFLNSVAKDGENLQFFDARSATGGSTMFEAAVFSEGRSLLDWITRNKFCPACGSPTYSLWGGWKLSCSSLLPWANNEGKEPCPSSKGLQNYHHPRTDPVVIVAVIDETGDRILLGRGKRFPAGMFSTLAGFCEPAESFEDTVKREIWEEGGIRVHDVHYHSSQPWPYPANLMVGYYAFADSSQPIRTDLDNELAEARWFTREEVKAVLATPEGTKIRPKEFDSDNDPEQPSAQVTAYRVPPRTAIGGVLISDWAAGKFGAIPPRKGNL